MLARATCVAAATSAAAEFALAALCPGAWAWAGAAIHGWDSQQRQPWLTLVGDRAFVVSRLRLHRPGRHAARRRSCCLASGCASGLGTVAVRGLAGQRGLLEGVLATPSMAIRQAAAGVTDARARASDNSDDSEERVASSYLRS